MTKFWIGLSMGFLLGLASVLITQELESTKAASHQTAASGVKRILVPFAHLSNIGATAGHETKPGEDRIDAGSELEIWNIDDTRSLVIKEIYFTAPDGTTCLEGSKYGLPLPLELKPRTHYHFNSFYEHFRLPFPAVTKDRANFIHGYLADIRWSGPAPRVRGWDLGVKNGQYIFQMPKTVFEER